jgi:hypothetical protein
MIEHQLSWYAFLGRVLGKAIYDGILVDVSFAGFFCTFATLWLVPNRLYCQDGTAESGRC